MKERSGALASAGRRRLPLVGLLTARGLSLAGSAITLIVVPLYVLQDTGSVMATGVAGVFATVPLFVGGVLGGVLVDRLGFRRAAILADIASGIPLLAIPIIAASIGLPFWALLALAFLSGLLDTPGNTAKSALLPDLAESARASLARTSGAQSAVTRSASMIGAAIAALSLVWLGPLNSLLLDAATFAVSAMLLWICIPRPSIVITIPSASSNGTGYWREAGAGIRFLATRPILRNIVLLLVITNCFDSAGLIVLFPTYAKTVSVDGGILAVMVAFFAAGALSGASLFGWIGHRLPRRATLVVCFVLAGAPPYFAMAFAVPVPQLLTVFALVGVAAGSINPLLSTVLYEQIPHKVRARALGAMTTGVTAGMPIGSLLGGIAVTGVGLVATLILTGALYAAVTLTPLFGNSWRQLNLGQPAAATLPATVGGRAV